MLNFGSSEPLQGLFTSKTGKAQGIPDFTSKLNTFSGHFVRLSVDGNGSSVDDWIRMVSHDSMNLKLPYFTDCLEEEDKARNWENGPTLYCQ